MREGAKVGNMEEGRRRDREGMWFLKRKDATKDFNHKHLLSTCYVTYTGLWEKDNEFMLQNKCKSVLPKANITAHVTFII